MFEGSRILGSAGRTGTLDLSRGQSRPGARVGAAGYPRSRPRDPRRLLMVCVGVSAALIEPRCFGARRILVVNTSPSAPLGLYVRVETRPRIGSLVEVCLPSVQRIGALSGDLCATILKPVGAAAGDHVDTLGDVLRINGHAIAQIQSHDSADRELQVWRASRILGADEFFLYSGRVPNSYDSRYFGPVHSSDIIAVREPLLAWGGP